MTEPPTPAASAATPNTNTPWPVTSDQIAQAVELIQKNTTHPNRRIRKHARDALDLHNAAQAEKDGAQ